MVLIDVMNHGFATAYVRIPNSNRSRWHHRSKILHEKCSRESTQFRSSGIHLAFLQDREVCLRSRLPYSTYVRPQGALLRFDPRDLVPRITILATEVLHHR